MQREGSEKFPWKTNEIKFDLIRIPSFTFRESQTWATVLGLKFSGFLFRPSPNEPLAFWDAHISKSEWSSSAVWETLCFSGSILAWKADPLPDSQARKENSGHISPHLKTVTGKRGFPQGLHLWEPQQHPSSWYWLWGLQQQKYTPTKHFPSFSGKEVRLWVIYSST